MAKRTSRKTTPKRSRARRGAEGQFELQDEAAQDKVPMNVETALVLITFVALLVAFVLVEIKDASDFGRGLFG